MKAPWREHEDAAPAADRLQVPVTRDDHAGATRYRAREEDVIVGFRADAQPKILGVDDPRVLHDPPHDGRTCCLQARLAMSKGLP